MLLLSISLWRNKTQFENSQMKNGAFEKTLRTRWCEIPQSSQRKEGLKRKRPKA